MYIVFMEGKSSILRLYGKRKEGGRGPVSVRSTVQDKTTSIHEPDGQLIMCLVNASGSRNPREKRNYWEQQAPGPPSDRRNG